MFPPAVRDRGEESLNAEAVRGGGYGFRTADASSFLPLRPITAPVAAPTPNRGVVEERDKREIIIDRNEAPSATKNKAGFTATPVACGWAGAIIEVTRSFGQEQ